MSDHYLKPRQQHCRSAFHLSWSIILLLSLCALPSYAEEREECEYWASIGECEKNANYMLNHCQIACAAITKKKIEYDVDYGTTIGYDGLPFTIESVKERYVNETSCTKEMECVWPPPIVILPDDYPAKVTLAPPTAGNADTTLEDLHADGKLTSAQYMSRTRHSGGVAVAVKIVNFTGRRLKKMWDDGSPEGVYNGELPGAIGDRSVLMTYDGHAFKFVDADTNKLYRRVMMRSNVHFIVFEPDQIDDAVVQSQEYQAAKREEQFMNAYFSHHGQPWLAKYGRPKPALNMWPANYLGQTHTIETQHRHWTCDGDASECKPSSDSPPLELNLTVASHAGSNGPRVFVIENLLSEAECDHILRLGAEVIKDSFVGQGGDAFKSASRTSSTGWLDRRKSPILETMSLRFADTLGLPESRLFRGDLAEPLQVVRYQDGQQYNPHHDFADSSKDKIGQRFLTLLLYIKIPRNGGHTSFPKAMGGRGMRIKPKARGGAVLFYSMMSDGNGDDLSLHAGEIVKKSGVDADDEKWVCNLWIWDPNQNS